MKVEEFAVLVAALKHFGPKHRDEVLVRRGVREEDFAEAERRWTQTIVDTTSQEDNSVVEAFGLTFVAEQRRLREERPALSSLGALPVSPAPGVAQAPAGPALPAKASPACESGGTAPPPKILSPSYMKHDTVTAPVRLAPPASSSGDETVIGGAPSPRPLPFDGRLREPPAVSPIEPAPDAGGTVLIRLPEAVRAAVARLLEPDPDATQLPAPDARPVIPFSGTSTPERMREIAGQFIVRPADDAGETVMMPTPAPARIAALRAHSGLSLREYAALRAALSAYGEDNTDVLARFGLTPAGKQALQEKYFDLFRAEPAVRERFGTLLQEEMRKLSARSETT